MDLARFRRSLEAEDPPEGLGLCLRALWLDARGDWDGAHELANEAGGRDGAWVHAYLHRREGDLDNARYWYARAGRPESTATLEREWEEIAGALLRSAGPEASAPGHTNP